MQVASELLFVVGIDAKQRLMARGPKDPVYYYRSTYTAGLGKSSEKLFNIAGKCAAFATVL